MKTAIAICYLLLGALAANAQYYLRGEIHDENKNPLPNARMLLHSNGLVYYAGNGGSFGIAVSQPKDSLTITVEGYQVATVAVDANAYQEIILKSLFPAMTPQKNKLVSITRNFSLEDRRRWTVGAETYSTLVENPFVSARKYPETGFAIHTDKASYSNIRRFLNMNTMVPPDAVRVEELLNYFNFAYQPPKADSLFSYSSFVTDCPWNPENQLLFLQLNSRKLDPSRIPQSNLVFLIDISGSMDMPNRLPLLKSAFKMLVENLREKDTVSIVVYGSTVGVWLPPTSGIEKDKIRKSIEDLYPGGATPGESGIRTAYRLARSQYIKGGNNRVILATDGDFNIGSSSEDDLDKLITQQQQYGIYLSCLGVGMGNYKDSKLEVLARKGNGNFAYLDNEAEAEKVLVRELTQTLFTVADNAYLSIAFNPDEVREYRLLGYDNKVRALADSLSEIEGGEVGPGHSLLAMFEISAAIDLRANHFASRDGLATVQVQYRLPNDTVTRFSAYTCPDAYTEFREIPPAYQFATSVAMFAFQLKESKYARRYSWNDVIIMADQAMDPNDGIQQEFLTMIEKAKKIYGKGKKRRRN